MEDHQIKTLTLPARSPDLKPHQKPLQQYYNAEDGWSQAIKAEFFQFLLQSGIQLEIMPRCIKAKIKYWSCSTTYWLLNPSNVKILLLYYLKMAINLFSLHYSMYNNMFFLVFSLVHFLQLNVL